MKKLWNPKERLLQFQRAIVATRLLAKLGFANLADIPDSLPEPIQSDFRSKLQEHLEDVEKNGLPWRELKPGHWVAKPRIQEEGTGSMNDIADLALFGPENEHEKSMQQRLPLEQGIVMYFAHLDAFLQDIFQAACRSDHRLLNSSKQISFKDVVNAKNWDSVIDVLIDKLLFELGYTDLEGKIKQIQSILHVNPQIPEGLLENLKIAEQARHAFVHTGGIVSKLITERLKGTSYSVGDRFGVSLKYCQQVSEGVLAFGVIVFDAIANKFWPQREGFEVAPPD